MRGGTPRPRLPVCSPSRIIPADAGNTPCMMSCPYRPGDHPRGCGEHVRPLTEWSNVQGSSPRMRGTLWLRSSRWPAARIIPADAGNTWRVHDLRDWARDHPRGCGEHFLHNNFTLPSQGSSPRMRGTPPPHKWGIAGRGIIPADAGNTYLPICRI